MADAHISCAYYEKKKHHPSDPKPASITATIGTHGGNEMSETDFYNKTLYKYRSLNDFKRFMDILVNERLYSARYDDFDDEKEGSYYFRVDEKTEEKIKEIRLEKKKLRICSLSEDSKNKKNIEIHADGGKGVILGIKLDSKNIDIVKIKYGGLPVLELNEETEPLQKAKLILSHKTESWSYEKEIRVFTNNKYVQVKIEEIIFGPHTAESDKKLIRDIVKRMKLNVKFKEWKGVSN